jgi:Interferon-induced 6-16 family
VRFALLTPVHLVASKGRKPGDPDPDPSDPSPDGPLAGFFQNASDHPVRTAFQVIGGLSILTAAVALPVLGAVGFTAAGPAAGSAAAAWQASIGLVEAGSFFAWCQSAAMGGAAVQGIIATGVAGAGVAGGATFAERVKGLFRRG